jgi:tetratricopeptide (TPR) repeat protein
MKLTELSILLTHKLIAVFNTRTVTRNLITLLLMLLIGYHTNAAAFGNNSKGSDLKNKIKLTTDTAEIFKYSRLALKMSEKKPDLEEMKGKIDTAEMLCKEADIELPAILLLARAEYFLLSNDFDNAFQEGEIALKKSRSNNESNIVIKTMNFLGKYYFRTQFYQESIDCYSDAITMSGKLRIKGIIPENYLRLASVYESLEKLEELRNSLQMSIKSAAEEMDTFRLEIGYYRLGRSYLRDTITDKYRDFNRGDSLLKRCLEISIAFQDTNYMAASLADLGWNLYVEKRYSEAIASYNKSLFYSIPSGKYGKYGNPANAFGNLGTIYRDLGVTEMSLKFYSKSIEQAIEINDIYDLWWVYRDMSELYLRKRDTSNAFKCYVNYKKYSDKYIISNNSMGLSNAKIRYEADAHNKELELLSLRIRNQRLLLYGSTSLFVLCLAVSILIISRSRINARRRISDMNHKISEITQANLRQQMNPHFIFNTLNSIQYYMYQHDKLATNNYLTKFSSLMRKVLENSQHTSIPLRDELDALILYLELEKIRFKDKFDYQINIDEEIDIILYKVPTMLIQPYVENSISHGLMPCEGKGMIKIDLELKNDYISCIIEDNGIGREAAQVKKMKSDNNHNSLGTQIAASRLDLVNSLYGTSLKIIYTDLKDGNGESTGTRVEIQIPLLS